MRHSGWPRPALRSGGPRRSSSPIERRNGQTQACGERSSPMACGRAAPCGSRPTWASSGSVTLGGGTESRDPRTRLLQVRPWVERRGVLVPFACCRGVAADARLRARVERSDADRPLERGSRPSHMAPAIPASFRRRPTPFTWRRTACSTLHVPPPHQRRGRQRGVYDVECLYPDRKVPIPLGDLDAASPICNSCCAPHIFRPDED